MKQTLTFVFAKTFTRLLLPFWQVYK